MWSRSRHGFVMSVILHLAVVVFAIVMTFVRPRRDKPPAVFELVSLPAPAAEIAPADSMVDFTMPEVKPLPPRPKPEPKPPPPEVVIPPKPTPKVPEPVPQKPPEPQPKPLSYEDFVKQHGQPQAQQPRKTTPKPVVAPRIDTKFTATIRETMVNLGALGPLSEDEQSAWDRYIARLREALRRTWDKPSGLAHNVAAVVEFDVAANGRLSNAIITKSSGIPQFDGSVLGSISTLGSAGTTPDGRPQRLRLTFRMTDQ